MQTPAFSAGQFRFTSTAYTVSQHESTTALSYNTGMKPLPNDVKGARVSVTRVGGAVGRVKVAYAVTNVMFTTTDTLLADYSHYSSVTNDATGTNLLGFTRIYVTNYFEYPQVLNYTSCTPYSIWTDAYTNVYTQASGVTNVTFGTNLPIYSVFGPFPGTSPFTIADGSVTYQTYFSTNRILSIQRSYAGAIAYNAKTPKAVWDYKPTVGLLTFNDYEMTKDIYVTVDPNNTSGNAAAYIQVNLTSATNDPGELPGFA